MSDKDRDDQHDSNGRNGRTGLVDLHLNVGFQSITDLLDGLDAAGDRSDPSPAPSAGSEAAGREGMDYVVETTRFEDEFVVTADLPGTDESDVNVSIDLGTNELVIATDGGVVERVPLPWAPTEATKVWFNNGVLEVRLVPTESGGDGAADETDDRSTHR